MYKQPTIYKTGNIYKLDGGAVVPDNFEVPKSLAIVGDEVYADSNGAVHFVRTSTLDTDTIPASWEYVGVVALRDSGKLTVLYKTENTNVKWASMWLFKVNGLKLDGTDTFVLQQGPTTGNTPVEIGTFTASESATDLDTLVSELDTWLRANATAEGALANYKWHAEKHADVDGVDSCFIVVDNINYQSRFSPIKSSSSGASAQVYMWDWCGFTVDSNTMLRKDGVMTFSCVWNKERFKVVGTNVNNPTDSLTTSGIFSEEGFNGTTVVKAHYGTYDNYLDNMVPDEDATTGAYAFYKGKGMEAFEGLSDVTFKNFEGTDTAVFPAEAWAASLGQLDGNDFIIPSIDTSYKIFSAMKVDGSDDVNSSMTRAGATAFTLSANRWAVMRYNNTFAWINSLGGSFGSNVFNNANRCNAVVQYDVGE